MDSPSQAVTVNVIEPEELLCAGQTPIGSPKSIRALNQGPMLTMNGFKFQGSPLIEAQNRTVFWSPMVKFKNAVFFSRTPGPEISSKFWFAVPRGLLGEGASVSTRY